MNKSILMLLITTIAVNGCARLNSIYRDEKIPHDEANVILVDSKQRSIISVPVSYVEDNQVIKLRLCSEPPPDVFSAIASSLAANASVEEAGNISAGLSAALSENASTIERTQTINVLREMMYSTCMRYLNGAIGESEFIVQSARDQQTMVATLAIEQITGVQKAQATALLTASKGSAGGVSSEALVALDGAKKSYSSAKLASEKKRSEATKAEPADLTCEKAIESADSQHETKKKLCVEASNSEKVAKEEKAHYEALNMGVSGLSQVTANSSGSSTSAALSGNAMNEAVAEKIVQIVKSIGDFDEIRMTCVTVFRMMADGKITGDSANDLQIVCLNRIRAEAALEAAEMDLQARQISKRAAELTQVQDLYAKEVWAAVAPDGKPKEDAFEQLLSKADGISGDFQPTIRTSLKRELLAAKNVDEFSQLFGNVDPLTQRALAAATKIE